MAKGIDVSSWQREINWKKVKEAGIEFAMIREGYGRNEPNQVDKYFHTNIQKAQEQGIYCGVYHYSYAISMDDAVNEANFCIENIKRYKLEYPVAFDIEDKSMIKLGKRTLTDICKAFCDTLEQNGYYAMIYTNKNWLENYLYKDELLPKYDLWIAEWNVDKPSYSCGMWRFSDKGSVYGIDGSVDMNLSYKNYSEIIKNKGLNGFKTEINNSNSIMFYTVNVGETLWYIAKKYLGNGNRYREIMKLNNLSNDTIYHGQILKIPSESTENYKIHTVNSGETLWGIAEKYYGDGNKYKEIKKINGLDEDTIYPNQVLKI
ncbi:MAG: GH25 family lysozyme [Acutalibacteraceae bacterium]